jgi:hypothetical protein
VVGFGEIILKPNVRMGLEGHLSKRWDFPLSLRPLKELD